MLKTLNTFLIGAVSVLIFSCNATIEAPKISNSIEYKITKTYIDKGLDRYLIDVELNIVINENSIHEISEYIKKTHQEASNMIIKYSLKNVTNGLWARVDYLPNYKLDQLGVTESENIILENANLDKITNIEILGKWKDLSAFSTRALILYKRNNKHFIRWYYKDKSYDDINLKQENDKYIVINRNGYDEWYIIEQNGNLGTYSSKGKYSESTPIK